MGFFSGLYLQNEMENTSSDGVVGDASKIAKFSVLVDEIYNTLVVYDSKRHTIKENIRNNGWDMKKIVDPSLGLIFDYNDLNEYARVIMDRMPIDPQNKWDFNLRYSGWCEKMAYKLGKRDEKVILNYEEKIKETKQFVSECKEKQNIQEGYKFVFWALMIIAVDPNDSELHISEICNFASMLNIQKSEIEDIIYIIKLIFNKVDDRYDFKSEKVIEIFGKTLNRYNYYEG